MTLREKILVGLMIVAVAIGGLVIVSDGTGGRTANDPAGAPDPLTEMLTRLTNQFDSGPSLQNSRYILATAQSLWQKTLFLDKDSAAFDNEDSIDAAQGLPANVTLTYSGYIETPRRRVAVINGIEYVVGDQLDQSTYIVHAITPQQVVITTPQQRMLAIPLVESWEVDSP